MFVTVNRIAEIVLMNRIVQRYVHVNQTNSNVIMVVVCKKCGSVMVMMIVVIIRMNKLVAIVHHLMVAQQVNLDVVMVDNVFRLVFIVMVPMIVRMDLMR
ncbi:unnamed protein product [Onchocerca flexuosa]|uniref:Hypotheticial protein n=1 Tax=Onchocerca flexuosa TaxID=387005 RepID=A0A183I7N4_9BILA|nr:unnamed protein product [Onchocerca flexuosa]